jgi:hypothetical protein
MLVAVLLVQAAVGSAAVAPPTAGVSTLQGGTIHVDGQPFFPFGFYHTSWARGGTLDHLLSDMRAMAAAGFNTLHAAKITEVEDWGRFLDDARLRGMKVISDDVEVADIPALRAKAAVLGWSIRDDVNFPCGRPPAGKTAGEVRARHDAVRAVDPHHLTYMSGSATCASLGTSLVAYMTSADLFGLQSYPIGNPGVDPNPLMENFLTLKNAVAQAAPFGRPIIGNLQAFAWKSSRVPTAAESRAFTYGALMAGVKGIIAYVYYDEGMYLPDHPALLGELTAQIGEIRQLAPALLGGTRSLLTTGNASVVAAQWTYQDAVYVVVLNTSTAAAASVSIAPAKASGPAQALFTGRPSGLAFLSGKLTGTVRPMDVHVYRLKGVLDTPPATPSGLRLSIAPIRVRG